MAHKTHIHTKTLDAVAIDGNIGYALCLMPYHTNMLEEYDIFNVIIFQPKKHKTRSS